MVYNDILRDLSRDEIDRKHYVEGGSTLPRELEDLSWLGHIDLACASQGVADVVGTTN
jgi:hypothetical protein